MTQKSRGHAGNRLRFEISADTIKTETERLIKEAKALEDSIAAIPEGERTFSSVVQPLVLNEAKFQEKSLNLTFFSYVSANKEVRDVSTECTKTIEEFEIESAMREDVFLALKTVKEKEWETLSADQQRVLARMLRDYERNGLNLPQDKRDEVKELKKRLSQLSIDFNQALNEDNTRLSFTREELIGLPEDLIDSLEKDGEEKYFVSMKYPELFPALRYAKNSETRRKLDTAKGSQCQEKNVPLFEEAIEIRHKLSQILGFKDHASYILDIRMAKNSGNVLTFEEELKKKLIPAAKKELDVLRELKQKECEEAGVPFDGKIHSWDFRYYDRMLNEIKYEVNDNEIKNYFPLDTVLTGLFNVFQKLFAIKFEKVENPETWHEDVTLYNVIDEEDGSFVGQFYLDLHPREGKYGHAAAFSLQPSYIMEDGARSHAISAQVSNFTKPTKTQPSLLKHDEVVTLFHEFGHLLHGVCTKAKYARFSGTSVERDFVECPSQLMENWCWEPEALTILSKHYETGASLPEDTIKKMVAAKNVNAGLLNLRQIFFGLFDMTVHQSAKVDTGALWAKLREEVALVPAPEGTNGSGSFGHLMGGYDAGYYGYLWSEVYSADLFSRFKAEGVFSREAGKHYRRVILESGGMRDGDDMIRDFLGRDPSQTAFLESLGISQ